ncbi:hypothetical protein DICPUDRAFT_29193, partial [Dictyostelium purpureum]
MKENNDIYFESLFWKVFHNRYILSKILNQIYINEWFSYFNYDDYNIKNRIRFKHIHSLDWMVDNNQIALLKCKLEAKEFISIINSTCSLKNLFCKLEENHQNNN